MPGVARLGDLHEGICDHGQLCCPHKVAGKIVSGSGNTYANGRPIARLNDEVEHNCPHCGTGNISSASGTVKVNGMGAARLGDTVTYPGGNGKITTAVGSVFAGV
jgi:uncharacterized Zn-binding protein involved in type VI secretion